MRALTFMGISVFTLAVAATSAFGAEEQTMPEHWRIYIGTYTGGESEGIYQMRLDAESGELELVGLAAETTNPSFLALHPNLPVVYAVGEVPKDGENPGGTISAFRIDAETGALELLNRQSTVGAGPCHVAVAPSAKHVAVANYGGGSVALLPIDAEGRLGEATDFHQHKGRSVNPNRQEGPHVHSVTFDHAGRFLYVADLGLDKMFIYRYDAEAGKLTPNDPPFALTAPGAGPRHFKIHPSGAFAYVVNELDNTVTSFYRYSESGALAQTGSVSTLPAGYSQETYTAEIRVHPSGRYVYASNRGHDSIAAFAVHAMEGTLTPLGQTSTSGAWPRNFNIDPSGRFLVAANQNSHNVVVLRIDLETGALEPMGQEVSVPAPVCVLFVP